MAFSNDEKQEIKDIVLETMTEQSDAVDYTEQVVEFAPGDEVPIVRNGDGTGEKSYCRAPVSMFGGGGSSGVNGIKVGGSGQVLTPTSGVVTLPAYESGAEKNPVKYLKEAAISQDGNSLTIKDNNNETKTFTPIGGGGNTADVNYDTTDKKITKTIDGTTSDVVTVETLKTDMNLGNVGNFKAVSTAASQGLTDTEKGNARTNIDAGTSNFSGDYDDLANKPTIPCADKSYAPLAHSGLGRKNLELKDGGSNVLTEEDFDAENTIYVIQYDFTVEGTSENISLNFTSSNVSGVMTPEKAELDAATAAYDADPTPENLARKQRAQAAYEAIGSQDYYYWASYTIPAQHCLHLTRRAIRLNDSKNAQVATEYNQGIIYAPNNESLTVYVGNLAGQYSYLKNGYVRVPANCVLEFDGGSISGAYTITGNNTGINANKENSIFTAVSIAGTWNITEIYATWFSDVEQTNRLKQVFNLTSNTIHNNVYLPSNLNCSVNAVAGEEQSGQINIKSYTNFYFEGTITLQPNSLWGYIIVEIKGVKDVIVKGSGVIVGDKDNHTMNTTKGYTTNEWGYGLLVGDSQNVVIDGIFAQKCIGDGFVFSNSPEYRNMVNNYVLKNVKTYDTRRDGITIEICNTVLVENFVVDTVSGTPMQAGLIIEPGWYFCHNVTIKNGIIKNGVSRGIIVTDYHGNPDFPVELTNITIENVSVENNSEYGFVLGGVKDFSVNNIKVANASIAGVTVARSSDVTLNNIDIIQAPQPVSLNAITHGVVSQIDFHTNKNASAINLVNCNDIALNGLDIDATEVGIAWGADGDSKNIKYNNCIIRTPGWGVNSFFTNCIFKDYGTITGFEGDSNVSNVYIDNCVFVNSPVAAWQGIFTNVTIKNCIIYYSTPPKSNYYYFIDVKNGSENVVLRSNRFIGTLLFFEIRPTAGHCEIIDNDIYSDYAAGVSGYVENSDTLVYKNLYRTAHLYSSDETLDASNIKVTYNGGFTIPQYLLDI